ncbi:Hypothetical protein CAP_8274 [Chondromyces apiculatus DSM 436]|uniref:Uncharacterized protein n=1 Tax=Chondromyces apiculatus DSM 436 TaxID=1192034 RepID=A0A017SYQ7_9BACT|nr:Hypothetical protein CAP_8274 [Chondromyces apiculatus DSM 436]
MRIAPSLTVTVAAIGQPVHEAKRLPHVPAPGRCERCTEGSRGQRYIEIQPHRAVLPDRRVGPGACRKRHESLSQEVVVPVARGSSATMSTWVEVEVRLGGGRGGPGGMPTSAWAEVEVNPRGGRGPPGRGSRWTWRDADISLDGGRRQPERRLRSAWRDADVSLDGG